MGPLSTTFKVNLGVNSNQGYFHHSSWTGCTRYLNRSLPSILVLVYSEVYQLSGNIDWAYLQVVSILCFILFAKLDYSFGHLP